MLGGVREGLTDRSSYLLAVVTVASKLDIHTTAMDVRCFGCDIGRNAFTERPYQGDANGVCNEGAVFGIKGSAQAWFPVFTDDVTVNSHFDNAPPLQYARHTFGSQIGPGSRQVSCPGDHEEAILDGRALLAGEDGVFVEPDEHRDRISL